MFGFNSLVFKLLQQSCNALEAYVEFLRQLPEHSGPVRAQVPPDGTVHELTTNAFMYLENLLEFADVMSVAVHVSDIGPQGNSNVLTFLSHNVSNCGQFRSRVGAFLCELSFCCIASQIRLTSLVLIVPFLCGTVSRNVCGILFVTKFDCAVLLL
ncbi:unnamed protein product [Echinostoma caproni]|uniref:Exocyst complex subunit Exo70 C-terminal domain-containing protein n=1 Tax=Echinostoma caproni TaxID=27848 RepID=A0A3P8GW70_9TREM|nr:unnamed protein product [Echinostoma caproni]